MLALTLGFIHKTHGLCTEPDLSERCGHDTPGPIRPRGVSRARLARPMSAKCSREQRVFWVVVSTCSENDNSMACLWQRGKDCVAGLVLSWVSIERSLSDDSCKQCRKPCPLGQIGPMLIMQPQFTCVFLGALVARLVWKYVFQETKNRIY